MCLIPMAVPNSSFMSLSALEPNREVVINPHTLFAKALSPLTLNLAKGAEAPSQVPSVCSAMGVNMPSSKRRR